MTGTGGGVIAAWNHNHPPGTPVIFITDDGTQVHTKTRSWAELLGGHTPVVWLEGRTGCYALDRVVVVGGRR